MPGCERGFGRGEWEGWEAHMRGCMGGYVKRGERRKERVEGRRRLVKRKNREVRRKDSGKSEREGRMEL